MRRLGTVCAGLGFLITTSTWCEAVADPSLFAIGGGILDATNLFGSIDGRNLQGELPS